GLAPGSSVAFDVDLPEHSELSFVLAAAAEPAAFRVELDGYGILMCEVAAGTRERHVLDHPAAADDPRPDVVLFLADTLRADVLAPYGGAPELAPNLNALAARSLRFECRSSATWTLPSISSLLSGHAPPQHGAVAPDLALGADALT